VAQGTLAEGKKNSQKRNAWIVFEDESSFSQRPPIRSTWAPRGQTPIISENFRWGTLSALGALRTDARGKQVRWFLKMRRGAFRSPHFLNFLRALKRHRRRPVCLVWDRLPAHRSGAVRNYVHQERSWLRIEWLPAYSPELNPVELLWAHLDANALANTSPDDLAHLAIRARRGVAKIQARPTVSRGFLRHTALF
jgi:transposase